MYLLLFKPGGYLGGLGLSAKSKVANGIKREG